MIKHKVETFIYEDFGFPILLVNAPLRKSFGEWVIDIDFNKLRRDVLNYLLHKHASLTGAELRFIRKHLEMTTTEFGKVCGVTHVAVLKWESGENRISPTTDLYVRLYVLQRLHAKNEEFGKLFYEISVEQLLSKSDQGSSEPMKIEAFA
ncbi:MAG: helix-turn-helix domain-containing protein [Chlamydiales bacterium]